MLPGGGAPHFICALRARFWGTAGMPVFRYGLENGYFIVSKWVLVRGFKLAQFSLLNSTFFKNRNINPIYLIKVSS
jgi:hypothetical protein